MDNKAKILLLHGALGSKKQLESLKALLASRFEIWDLNFEGHGGHETDREFSIALFTDQVKTFLEENNIQKINIFGYSMGGYVALNLARQNPELVDKIVTLGTKFDWTEVSAAREVKMLNPEVIEAKVPHFANQLKTTHHPSDWKKVMEKTAQMMLALGAKPTLQQDDFRQIKQATLIGIGSLDRMVSYEESKQVAQCLPNGNLQTLEDFPHPIDQVDTQKLSEFIQDFFS